MLRNRQVIGLDKHDSVAVAIVIDVFQRLKNTRTLFAVVSIYKGWKRLHKLENVINQKIRSHRFKKP